MTTRQHQYISRASRLLIYSLKWLEKVLDEELPDRELKRLQRAQEYVRKAIEKL